MNRLAAAVVALALAHAALAGPPEAEIDAFWRSVERAVAAGDFEAYAACCHPDGVLVSEAKGLSQPFAAAFERWKPEFADTRAGRMTAVVEIRVTRRLGDASTAHETGIFRYTSRKPGEAPRVDHVPFEALLVKRDGRWLMLMEHQKAHVGAAEWAAAPQRAIRTVCGRTVAAGTCTDYINRGIGSLGQVSPMVSPVGFHIVGEPLWDRMERAVERVNERLRRTVAILEDAKVPYAVVGGHAVRAWVAQVDEAAVRTTRDVDILVRPADFPALRSALVAAGFHHRETTRLQMFVETRDGSARDAVHVVLSGEMVRPGEHEANPDVEPAVTTPDFRTVPLETLVRMKLNSFRDKDRVHLRDMISLGMIDGSWLPGLPDVFAARLRGLLDDPDG